MLKEHHVKWVDMMKMIVKATPDLETTNKPKSKWRLKFYSFITGEGLKYNYFEIFILVIIVLNMIHMALDYDDAPAIYTSTLNNVNYVFTGIFFIECILKIIAYDIAYFTTSINKFDFFVVCTSLFEIVLTLLGIWSPRFIRLGPQLGKALRVVRVSRLLRLINRYRGLHSLL